MATTRKDPAEAGSLRFYYRNWRPTLYGRLWTRIWAWATSLGLLPDITIAKPSCSNRTTPAESSVPAEVVYVLESEAATLQPCPGCLFCNSNKLSELGQKRGGRFAPHTLRSIHARHKFADGQD